MSRKKMIEKEEFLKEIDSYLIYSHSTVAGGLEVIS
jgi:hypothetical protein